MSLVKDFSLMYEYPDSVLSSSLSAHLSYYPIDGYLWIFCSHCLCFQPLSIASLPAPCTALSQSFQLPKNEWYSLRRYAEVLTPGTSEHYLKMGSSQAELLKSGLSSNMTHIQRGRWYEGNMGKCLVIMEVEWCFCKATIPRVASNTRGWEKGMQYILPQSLLRNHGPLMLWSQI